MGTPDGERNRLYWASGTDSSAYDHKRRLTLSPTCHDGHNALADTTAIIFTALLVVFDEFFVLSGPGASRHDDLKHARSTQGIAASKLKTQHEAWLGEISAFSSYPPKEPPSQASTPASRTLPVRQFLSLGGRIVLFWRCKSTPETESERRLVVLPRVLR